jgi:hypothetical protein
MLALLTCNAYALAPQEKPLKVAIDVLENNTTIVSSEVSALSGEPLVFGVGKEVPYTSEVLIENCKSAGSGSAYANALQVAITPMILNSNDVLVRVSTTKAAKIGAIITSDTQHRFEPGYPIASASRFESVHVVNQNKEVAIPINMIDPSNNEKIFYTVKIKVVNQ